MQYKSHAFSVYSTNTASIVIAVITFAIVLTLPGPAVAQGLQWMHLLGPDTGWVASSSSVFWTTDNGQHWKDITPSSAIAGARVTSVFFLDTSAGWVLLSRYEESEPRFDLAFTKDSGGSWSLTHLTLAENPNEPTLLTQGSIQFTDAMHGWMNLPVQSGSAFHSGLLFHTTDGGKNWTLSQGPGTAGDLRFIDEHNGWIVSPDHRELWTTHNGASTWTQVVLKPPAQIRPADVANYQLPLFNDNKHGVISVIFSAAPAAPDADSAGSQVVSFATTDLGDNWRFTGVLAHLSADTSNLIATISDSALLTAHRVGDQIILARTPLTERDNSTVARANVGFFGAVLSLNFKNDQLGWILASTSNCSPEFLSCTRLLSTVDAGSTWVDISPGARKAAKPTAPSAQPVPLTWEHSAVSRPLSADELSIHLGFDDCPLYTTGQMGSIWSGSSFQDVGTYIGNFSNITCGQPSSSWIATVEGQGWGIMPLWSALQAPCVCRLTATCRPAPFSSIPSEARTQGAQQADAAVTAAQSLGLGGEIVYLDLEQYSATNPTCAAAGSAYVDGWVSQLHNTYHQLAGVYGSPTDAPTWTESIPDDMWFGKSDYRVTIWGMGYGTSDSKWPLNQRIHQFLQQTSIFIGGRAYSIDRDVEDATIVSSNLPKTLTFTPQQKNYIACETSWSGINNYNSLAGTYFSVSDYADGLLDYFGAGQDNYLVLPSTGVMTSLNNQCSTSSCTYRSPLANTAVGTQPTTVCGPRGINGINCGIPYGMVVVQGQQPATFTCSQGVGGTALSGVTDNPQFAGTWWDSQFISHGFVSPDTTGQKCQSFDPAGSTGTVAEGINGDGQVVGYFTDSSGAAHGFIYNYGNGINTTPPVQFDYPGATSTFLYGISNNGWILGAAYLSDSFTYFLYDENSGAYAPINAPSGNQFLGLNDNSYIVGRNVSNNGACYDGLILNTPLVP